LILPMEDARIASIDIGDITMVGALFELFAERRKGKEAQISPIILRRNDTWNRLYSSEFNSL